MDRHVRRQGCRVGRHQLARLLQIERVDGIFLQDMPPAPGDLFGEDRAPHAKHADRIGESRRRDHRGKRSEEHTSELQSLMRISYAVFCLKKKITQTTTK